MIQTKGLAWAAGFLEGEGTFVTPMPSGSTVAVTAPQVQREPLERLREMFGGQIYRRSRGEIFTWVVYGNAAASVMMTICGMMSPKRQAAIVRALQGWRKQKLPCALRTHCPKGHPYAGANLARYKDGSRYCRACNRAWCRAHSQRRTLTRDAIRVRALPPRPCHGCQAVFTPRRFATTLYCSVRCGKRHRWRIAHGFFEKRAAS